MNAPAAPIHVTFLSSIAGPDFPSAVRRQAELGLTLLDLKDGLWGHNIEHVPPPDAPRAAVLCRAAGMEVHCFSTSIGRTPLEMGPQAETWFRARFETALENVLRVAAELPTQFIRLLMPQVNPSSGQSALDWLQAEAPWVVGVYRDWIDRIAAAGFGVLLENEVHGCLFSTARDVTGFFEALRRAGAARYTWDVQNMWQSGVFPSLEVYREVRPFMGALHLKGGRAVVPGGPLITAAPLEEASWPVLEVVRAAIADGVAPVICLNPSHGAKPPGWDTWEIACRDLAFLRREIKEIC